MSILLLISFITFQKGISSGGTSSAVCQQETFIMSILLSRKRQVAIYAIIFNGSQICDLLLWPINLFSVLLMDSQRTESALEILKRLKKVTSRPQYLRWMPARGSLYHAQDCLLSSQSILQLLQKRHRKFITTHAQGIFLIRKIPCLFTETINPDLSLFNFILRTINQHTHNNCSSVLPHSHTLHSWLGHLHDTWRYCSQNKWDLCYFFLLGYTYKNTPRQNLSTQEERDTGPLETKNPRGRENGTSHWPSSTENELRSHQHRFLP